MHILPHALSLCVIALNINYISATS